MGALDDLGITAQRRDTTAPGDETTTPSDETTAPSDAAALQSHDITVQYCIMAEAIHPQSFGALIDSVTNVTLSHNLWMSNESRNPKVKGTVQYINNVVYNWGETGLCGGHSSPITPSTSSATISSKARHRTTASRASSMPPIMFIRRQSR